MTRDEWLKVRGEPYIPLGVWFSYYKERGGDITDPVEFESIFSKIIRDRPKYMKDGRVKHITAETARYNLTSYYDSIFSI